MGIERTIPASSAPLEWPRLVARLKELGDLQMQNRNRLLSDGVTDTIIGFSNLCVCLPKDYPRFDFEFAPGAILCLFHDASIVCGIWVLTGELIDTKFSHFAEWFASVEVASSMICAEVVPRTIESSTRTILLPFIKSLIGLSLSLTPNERICCEGSIKVRPT